MKRRQAWWWVAGAMKSWKPWLGRPREWVGVPAFGANFDENIQHRDFGSSGGNHPSPLVANINLRTIGGS